MDNVALEWMKKNCPTALKTLPDEELYEIMIDSYNAYVVGNSAKVGGLPTRKSSSRKTQLELNAMSERDRALTSVNNIEYGKRNKEDLKLLKIIAQKDSLRWKFIRSKMNFIKRTWRSETLQNKVRQMWFDVKGKYPYIDDHRWSVLFGHRWIPSDNFCPYTTDNYVRLERAIMLMEKIQSGEVQPSKCNPYVVIAQILREQATKEVK